MLAAIAVALVLAPAGGSATGERHARPASPARARASYLVTLAGAIRAGLDSRSSAGMIDTKTSFSYQWRETLAETVSTSTGRPVLRTPGVTGKGSVQIDVLDSRTYGENHSLSCAMSLRPDSRGIHAREPLRLSFDPAAKTASVSGLIPVNLVDAIYSGPPQLNGLAPPCLSAHPYEWMAALAIPLKDDPQAAPFKPLSCSLRRIGSSCSAPFSLTMTWPTATGTSSLALTASLIARRLPPSHPSS